MIGIGRENDRFAQALRDEFLRKRLMVEYARRSKVCGWAAVLQVGLAFVLFLTPNIQEARYVFLCIALGFVIICLKLRRDLRLLKLADRQGLDEPPTRGVAEAQAEVKPIT
jgi:hypothetical protein